MPQFIQKLLSLLGLGGGPRPARGPRPTTRSGKASTKKGPRPLSSVSQPPARAAQAGPAPSPEEEDDEAAFVALTGGVDNIDAQPTAGAFRDGDHELFVRIGNRIDRGNLELPYLPNTSMAVMDMANNPSAELKDMVELISSDPMLSSELLKTANSVLYAGQEPVETLHEATMRIGLRQLRSLIFSISLRGAVFRGGTLDDFASEIWRQAQSVANIAREIAQPLGFDPDKSFLLGLLHDIGKVSLLAMLRQEITSEHQLTRAQVGRVFWLYHECAGRAMAQGWNLSPELVSVAGCHHDFKANTEHPRSAAFVRLAHSMDLFLSTGGQAAYKKLATGEAMRFLGVDRDRAEDVLKIGYDAYVSNLERMRSAA